MSLLEKALKSLILTPERVGRVGETHAALRLGWADFCGYPGKVLRNVYIPKANGETTEIDLLYVTAKGIFVIESKNYSGYIFGSEQNQNWTVTLFAGQNWMKQNKIEKHHFYNPIRQNRSHIQNLRRFLGKEIPMFSVIVFSSRCELKEINISSPDVLVCQQGKLPAAIRKIWNENPDILSEQEIESICAQLSRQTNQSEEVKQQHVEAINRHLNDTTTCPWCGGELVLRTAKQGKNAGHQFYGCSNYPRCKFIKNV